MTYILRLVFFPFQDLEDGATLDSFPLESLCFVLIHRRRFEDHDRLIIQDRNNQDWIYVGWKLRYFGVNDSEGQISKVISV